MDAVPQGPYLGLSEVLKKYGMKKTTWYMGMRKGIYPASINVAERRVVWSEFEIEAAIQALNKKIKNGKKKI